MAKQITILGAGESGIGAALLAKSKGYNVFVSDGGKIKDVHIAELDANDITYETGQHTKDKILLSDEVIKSPGIPNEAEIVTLANEKGIPVISEIEFASRYANGKIIAITGSNGKTTTATLTHHILKNADLDVSLVGNIGKSFARQIFEQQSDYYVLEISSFQLDNIIDFKPDMAIILNITPDHLDRYNNDFQKYVEAKFKIAANQTTDDQLIYCLDDETIVNQLEKAPVASTLIPFTIKKKTYQEVHSSMMIN